MPDYRIEALRLDVDASGDGVAYLLIETWPPADGATREVVIWSWAAAHDGQLDPYLLANKLRESTSRLIGVDLPEIDRTL